MNLKERLRERQIRCWSASIAEETGLRVDVIQELISKPDDEAPRLALILSASSLQDMVLHSQLLSRVDGLRWGIRLAYLIDVRPMVRFLVERSVRRLPPDLQIRYREEWAADSMQFTRSAARLQWAVELFLGSWRLRHGVAVRRARSS